MITAMFLAHLMGDYILQWNALAAWKSRSQKGILLHGFIVLLVTWLFSLPYDPGWWRWALLIGVTHTVIDGLHLALSRRFNWVREGLWTQVRFVLDQILHLAIIAFALAASGYLSTGTFLLDVLDGLRSQPWLTYLLGYAFVMMPAWVIGKYLVYALIQGGAPDFAAGADKYLGIVERILITTLIVLGQYIFVPLITVLHLRLQRRGNDRLCARLYQAEVVTGTLLAVIVGLSLRYL